MSHNMKKEITLSEWLEIASVTIASVAASVKDDGKITIDEAVKLLISTLTAIVNAYNN